MNLAALRSISVGDAADTPFHGAPVQVDYDAPTNKYVVRTPPMEADRMRLIFGARYQRNEDVWTMPATRSQTAALSGIFDGRLDTTQAAKDHAADLFQVPMPADIMLNPQLFPFQEEGVRLLASVGSALLGDSMGTGKTIQAIEWMRVLGNNDDAHLVVCPNSMKYKWVSEVEEWWPAATVIAIDGSAVARRKQIAAAMESLQDGDRTVVVINYESLKAHTRLAPYGGKALTAKQKEDKEFQAFQWQTLVVDEAHRIKDPKAQQTMAVKQMGKQAAHRLAMTGTPLLNNPDDVWSVMSFVAPDEWGSLSVFRNRYCQMTNAWHGGFENLGLKRETMEEFDKFFQPRFLRRTKTEVLKDLPEKMPIDYRLLPLGSKQQKLYDALAKDMMAMAQDELLIAENPLSLLIRLRQAASAHLLVENGEVLALETPSNKLDAIKDILAESPGDPLVIYAESRKLIEMFARELGDDHRIGLVTGQQTATQRDKAVSRFQDGKLDIILGTLGAGAEGLTLTRANRIILAQQSWSHGVNAQAIDRVHRIGQTQSVQPIVLVSKGTVDEATALVDKTKEIRMQELVRDPDWLEKAMRGAL